MVKYSVFEMMVMRTLATRLAGATAAASSSVPFSYRFLCSVADDVVLRIFEKTLALEKIINHKSIRPSAWTPGKTFAG